LKSKLNYSGDSHNAQWEGYQVVEQQNFLDYIKNTASRRLLDQGYLNEIESDLQGLATTGMSVDFLKEVLEDQVKYKNWEIGEALAECILEEEENVVFPWNMLRDKRDPNASLPGADLVGFVTIGNEIYLLIGEVKTSSQNSAPPSVLSGRSGMVHQLEKHVEGHEKRRLIRSIIHWLHARTKNTDYWNLFKKAIRLYLNSKGEAFALYGILLRDTAPNELDLKNRAKKLGTSSDELPIIRLFAWYFPIPIDSWSEVIKGE